MAPFIPTRIQAHTRQGSTQSGTRKIERDWNVGSGESERRERLKGKRSVEKKDRRRSIWETIEGGLGFQALIIKSTWPFFLKEIKFIKF
jgi:hypothetical protein